MVRFLLAITHRLLRAAVLEYLGAGEVLCEEAGSVEELWDQLCHYPWDVLILDFCLPQHTKLQTLQTLHGRYPNVPILVISFAVVEAVKRISEGGTYFSSEGPEGKIL